MQQRILGRTGIKVTELVFGALPLGPMQKNIPFPEAVQVIKHGLEEGINFIDTAQSYKTQKPIGAAIKEVGIRPVISTKSAAVTYEDMEKAIKEAQAEMGIETIDLFYLHASRASAEVYTERAGALECLKEYKAKGVIRGIGVATHSVTAIAAAAEREDIDVVFPLLNIKGRGILDGSREDMMEAISANYHRQKGIVIMKALAGGHLIDSYQESLEFIREFGLYHCIAIGMVTPEEVDYNVGYFNGELDPQRTPPPLTQEKRAVVVKGVCIGCGKCIEGCHSGAIVLRENKAQILHESCLMCGYCTTHCPQFAIRIV